MKAAMIRDATRITKARRSAYLFFHMDGGYSLDIGRVLQGDAALTSVQYILAASPLTRKEHALTLEEFQALYAIPVHEWVCAARLRGEQKIPLERIEWFAERGLVITDAPDPHMSELKRREEVLDSEEWNPYGALYHMMTRWQGVRCVPDGFAPRSDERGCDDAHGPTDEAMDRFVEAFGHPPDPFHQIRGSKGVRPLPLINRLDGVFGALEKRRTTRSFDTSRSMLLEHFTLLLYYAFGCHGIVRTSGNQLAIRKTSPSGGGFHPVEVYPLVRDVEGVAPGLYHYDVKNHALELIESLSKEAASDLADEFTAGQHYPRCAHALFIMTARFYRNHWKYRRHPKTYGVILMDAAHLSQTIYLVTAQLGLGAFFTAAINGIDIEARLGLDGFSESAIGISGAGIPAITKAEPEFRPYVPRQTMLQTGDGARLPSRTGRDQGKGRLK